MKNKRIEIKTSDDLNDILSDMLSDFLENITDYEQYTNPADGDSLFEYEEGIEFYYTDKGSALVERWHRRMKVIYDRYFDDDNFNPQSTYYKTW